MLPWGQTHYIPVSKVDSNNYSYRIRPPSAPFDTLVSLALWKLCLLIYISLRTELSPYTVFHLKVSKNMRVRHLEWDPAHT